MGINKAMPGTFKQFVCSLVGVAVFVGVARAGVEYERDIQPIFAKHCTKCHGPEKQTHGLRLDVRSGVLKGGDSGEPAVVAGKSGESHLIQLVTETDPKKRMPQEGDALSEKEIALLKEWIDGGAVMGAEDEGQLKLTTEHWSFQPVKKVGVPSVAKPLAAWVRNPVDAFVLAKLSEKGLKPSGEAARRVLVRRLYLDVHGLPPTPQEVERFVSDPSPRAYEDLVERVLASPRYGERMARHWLDVVRFAETNGFETNVERPNAWRYRDYVIDAFNADKPYNHFVAEQVAGDTMGEEVATGFLVGGTYDEVKSPDVVLTKMQRSNELADMVNTTSTAFLGLTVACARCHNHKFDPIVQKDYYAMESVFAGVKHGEREIGSSASSGRHEGELNAMRNTVRFEPVRAKFVRMTVTKTNNGIEPCIDELEVFEAGTEDNAALASRGAKATASSVYEDGKYALHRLHHVNDGKYGNPWSWISKTAGMGWVVVELSAEVEIDRVVWGRDREGKFSDRVPTQYVIEARSAGGGWVELASRRGGVMAYAGLFSQPEPTRRLFRGDPMSEREVVAPEGMEVLRDWLGSFNLTPDAAERERRVALARFLADERNPLTARVMVNRLWQTHFGTGIVATPSDLGKMGVGPTHPELLDWLAARFVEGGWSVKGIHRLILLSSTYRQSSEPREEAMKKDAGSRYLWRFPPRRMEAEAMRDAMLSVAGALDLTMHGPGFSVFKENSNYVRVYDPKEKWEPGDYRRMIYMRKVRMQQDGVFGVFDCPDAGQPTARRTQSTTAIQALNLMNSSFVLEQAERLAQRVKREAGDQLESQIDYTFRLAFGRPAEKSEIAEAKTLIAEHGLENFCRAVFNANEFLLIP